MKTCFKCGRLLALSEFYKHKKMADGHLNKCKLCTRDDARNHRRENLESIRQYDRARSKQPHRVANNARVTSKHRAEHPKRTAAHSAVGRALRSGRLQKLPCLICGSENVEAHHPDYDQPLSVVWLCVEHHRQIHVAYDEEQWQRIKLLELSS